MKNLAYSLKIYLTVCGHEIKIKKLYKKPVKKKKKIEQKQHCNNHTENKNNRKYRNTKKLKYKTKECDKLFI